MKVGNSTVTLDSTGNQSNASFGQKVEELEIGKTYTVCLKIDELTGNASIGTQAGFNGVEHTNVLKQGINTFTFVATGQWITLCCKPNTVITIEYIDLFEGDVVYKHVKEDYSTALMRCQRFLYPITSGQYSGIGEIVKYYDGYYVTFLPVFMANVSSVLSNIDRITAYAFSNGQGNQFVTIKSILFNNTNRTLLITLNEKLNLANGTTLLFQTLNTDDYMYLSCEPN